MDATIATVIGDIALVFVIASLLGTQSGLIWGSISSSMGTGVLSHQKGMQVVPSPTLENHPPLDVLVVPGGGVLREIDSPVINDWIRKTAASAAWTTSVSTGGFLLHSAGQCAATG